MLSFIVYLATCAILAHARNEEIMEFDNKTECINQLMQWCDGMQYPQQGVGMALTSVTYEDPKGYYRIFCSSDSEGTNCTRNGASWFACSPDHVMTYKGRIMTNGSTDVDNDICATASTAFNDLFVQNLSYDNTTMKTEVTKGFEAFFEQIAAMEEQIELIQKILRRIPSIENIWSEYDDSFLFEKSDSATSVTGSAERFDSTTSVGDDSATSVRADTVTSERFDLTTSASSNLQTSDDSTTFTPSSLQGSDSTTITSNVTVDNQNNTQLQTNQVEMK